MHDVTRHPLLVFGLSFLGMWLFARLGTDLIRKRRQLTETAREDFGVILAASLTLLGLIIGFTFSMAISRYDLRKTYEEAEANAIGTEYVRADFLHSNEAQSVRLLLKRYLELRIQFYSGGAQASGQPTEAETAQTQARLWGVVKAEASSQPTPIAALVVSGMNDVINSQGYAQAASWNQIPKSAWILLLLISILCNLMIGYGARDLSSRSFLLVVLPLVLSISFFLIADIDSPRGGIIRVVPQNLAALATSLNDERTAP